MDLTDRKKQILKVVVEDYIRTAEPVGSKAIAAEMGGSVSSATIRNELSDLVELGYLEQPHTSAGRVPSPKGYRLYVNELMERQRLSLAETEKINQSLQMKMEELDRVISQAGRAVSSFVNYPAYVATAGKGSITASRFDLLPVDEKSCIVVMMMGDNRVKSQLLRMQLKVDRDQMAALVNAKQHCVDHVENRFFFITVGQRIGPHRSLLRGDRRRCIGCQSRVLPVIGLVACGLKAVPCQHRIVRPHAAA